MSEVAEIQSSKEHKPTIPRHLPDDIACDIVSRLSSKEISYFKTFSRRWNKMLSDPSFKDLFHKRSQKNPKLFIAYISDTEKRDHNGEFIEEFILGLSLLDMEEEGTIYYANITRKTQAFTRKLCAANGGGLTCFVNYDEIFIFNPTSKKFANLPSTTSNIVNNVGFGYVPSSNEYIFVHIFDANQEEDEDCDMRCEWLTLSEVNLHEDIRTSLSWKVLETPCPFPARKSGVLVDGLFYFCVSDSCVHTAKQVIFSVDLKMESFKIIGHPDETLYKKHNTKFVVELNGQLCFGDEIEGPAQVDLWILINAEYTEWKKLCRVDLSRLHGFDKHFISRITLLGLRNGELIIKSIWSDRLYYYNIEEETSRVVNVSVPTWSQVCLYTESLSFLNIRSS